AQDCLAVIQSFRRAPPSYGKILNGYHCPRGLVVPEVYPDSVAVPVHRCEMHFHCGKRSGSTVGLEGWVASFRIKPRATECVDDAPQRSGFQPLKEVLRGESASLDESRRVPSSTFSMRPTVTSRRPPIEVYDIAGR